MDAENAETTDDEPPKRKFIIKVADAFLFVLMGAVSICAIVIRLMDGGMSCKKVADHYGVGKTQVQSILKRKREILDDFDNNCTDERKRKIRKTGFEDINQLLWEWFKDASARTIVITGPMLREKGLKFAKDLGLTDFKGSNGWLDSFLKRHNIKFGNMPGEAGDVKQSVVDSWKQKLPELCKDYDAKDIFNMDETGLFFRSTASKSFYVKGEKCNGGKMSKERLTVALCASMTGEKEQPIVIGKSANPRCFKKVLASSLPVKYYSNKKAWMTSAIFEDWLKAFDRKMRRQGRHVILFLDNAPSHPRLTTRNVKLQFLPPTTTSRSQPMDQGIIQAVKLKYRKRQLQHVISLMAKHTAITGSELLKQVSVLDAIYWVNRAWKEVAMETIVKCVSACGFLDTSSSPEVQVSDSDSDDDADDDLPLEVFGMSQELFGVPFAELFDIDVHISTCQEMRDWDSDAKDLLSDINQESDDDDDDTCASDELSPQQSDDTITISEAQEHVAKLRQFALNSGNVTLLNSIMDAEHNMNEQLSLLKPKQAKISDFFNSVPSRD